MVDAGGIGSSRLNPKVARTTDSSDVASRLPWPPGRRGAVASAIPSRLLPATRSGGHGLVGNGDGPTGGYSPVSSSARAALAELPDGDRIITFDAHRARLLALPDAIAVASPARREELCRIVVERVVVRDRQIEAIEWTPPMRPFLDQKRQRECPQGDSNP